MLSKTIVSAFCTIFYLGAAILSGLSPVFPAPFGIMIRLVGVNLKVPFCKLSLSLRKYPYFIPSRLSALTHVTRFSFDHVIARY